MICIGTRQSALAQAQAGQVAQQLRRLHPGLEVELATFVTSGDRLTGPLSEFGGKGLFTKEIEEALLAGEIDCAVHSAKDMPTLLPGGLIIAASPVREDARDALVGNFASLAALPPGAVVGSSSLRRSALVKQARPDVRTVEFRGNVGTRLDKLARGEVDATLLAMAGLKRLGVLADVPHVPLAAETFIPAVAQGALALECRQDDWRVRGLLEALNHRETLTAITCERAFLRALSGSCRTPIGGYAKLADGVLHLSGLVAAVDGSRCETIEGRAPLGEAESLGVRLGQALLARPGVAAMLGI